MYQPVHSWKDQDALQHDLDSLGVEHCGDAWFMTFNEKKQQQKPNILTIAGSKSPLSKFYTLCTKVVATVDEARYFGITLTSNIVI